MPKHRWLCLGVSPDFCQIAELPTGTLQEWSICTNGWKSLFYLSLFLPLIFVSALLGLGSFEALASLVHCLAFKLRQCCEKEHAVCVCVSLSFWQRVLGFQGKLMEPLIETYPLQEIQRSSVNCNFRSGHPVTLSWARLTSRTTPAVRLAAFAPAILAFCCHCGLCVL